MIPETGETGLNGSRDGETGMNDSQDGGDGAE